MSNARTRLPAYGRTPKELLRDPGVSVGAKTVYAMVDEVAGHEDVTIERLSLWLGVSAKTAKKYLHEIRDAGWVEVIEVIKPRTGQMPSEYVANAYPFQHVSEPEAKSSSSDTQKPQDGAIQQEESDPPVGKNLPESRKILPSDPSTQTGGSKSDPPRGVQKVTPPTYLRDDETVPPPTPPERSGSEDGFREFWAIYPDTGYKGRRAECEKLWLSWSLEDRHGAFRLLTKYLNSRLWEDRTKIPSPLTWLQNEPAAAYRAGNIPRQRLSPENAWMANG